MRGRKPNTFDEVVRSLNREDILDILAKVSKKSVSRYKQQFDAVFDKNIDEALSKFRDIVVNRSWKMAQKWSKWGNDAPILMPDYTRIYYRRGGTEVILQEFPPQIRMMKFKESLVNKGSTSDKVHTFSLALPYVIFIFKFQNGIFNNVRIAFNDRPLKTLKETPLRPFLSNLDESLCLCLGRDFSDAGLVKDNIAQQADYVLDHFWQTIYTNEWASHFWAYRENDVDPRFSSLQAWHDASIDNPLFVVEDVAWMPHANGGDSMSFGDIITGLYDDDVDDNSFQQALYDDIASVFVSEVREAMEEQVQSAEPSLKTGRLDDFADTLLEHFRDYGAKTA